MSGKLLEPTESAEVLAVLAKMRVCGAFDRHDFRTQEVIRGLIDCSFPDVQVSKAPSLYSTVYLVSSSVVSELPGLVVRVIPEQKIDLIIRAQTERYLLQQVVRDNPLFRIPQHLGYYATTRKMIFVSEMLRGKPVSEVVVGQDEAIRVARAIRYTQGLLSSTEVGKEILSRPDKSTPYYRTKVVRLVRKHFGIEVDVSSLSALDELDCLRQKSRVVVSDRTPVNFLFHEGSTCVIDLDLVLPGTVLEDWAWFINDDRLQTRLDRAGLLQIFCDEHRTVFGGSIDELSRYFYLASIFVSFKQVCMAHINSDRARKLYLLNLIKESTNRLSLPEVASVAEMLRCA